MSQDSDEKPKLEEGDGESTPSSIENESLAVTNGQEGQADDDPQVTLVGQYQPSGRVTFFGLLLMPVLGAAGAYVGSYLYWRFAEYLCTIVVLFPLIAGGIAGAGVTLGVRWGKIRNPTVAAVLGLLAGLLAFGMTYYWGYLNLQRFAKSYVAELGRGTLSDAEARDLADKVLLMRTNHSGLYGYALYNITGSRYTFFRVGSDTFDSYEVEPSETWFSWVMTIVNWLSAGVGGLVVGFVMSVFPFCEKDKRWLASEQLVRSSYGSRADLTILLLKGIYDGMSGFVWPPEQGSSFEMMMYYCPACREGYVEAVNYVAKERDLICRLEVKAQQVDGLLQFKQEASAVLKARAEAKAKAEAERVKQAQAEAEAPASEKTEETKAEDPPQPKQVEEEN